VFGLDMEHCPNCGGNLKIIAAILEQPVVEKIFTHLGLQARAPPRAAGPWPSLASGLSEVNHPRSSGPAPGLVGMGCARSLRDRWN